MKTYDKNGLTFLQKNDELYVTADSVFVKLGYDNSNKQRWYQNNITKIYSKGENYFYDINLGLCVQCEIMEEVCSNIKYNISKAKAVADLIAVEYHDFVKSHDWYDENTSEEGSASDYFYKEYLQPKVTKALDNITKVAETPFIDPKDFSGNFQVFSLPDEMIINGKKYLSEEKYQKDMVENQMKLDALKSMLLS